MKIYYNPKLKEQARKLRKNMTLGEVLLWKQIKGKQLLGYDFHRQKPVGDYIVDFICIQLGLVVEVDGSSHRYRGESDMQRQEKLEEMGFHVVRITETEATRNIQGVVDWLKQVVRRLEAERGIVR